MRQVLKRSRTDNKKIEKDASDTEKKIQKDRHYCLDQHFLAARPSETRKELNWI